MESLKTNEIQENKREREAKGTKIGQQRTNDKKVDASRT